MRKLNTQAIKLKKQFISAVAVFTVKQGEDLLVVASAAAAADM